MELLEKTPRELRFTAEVQVSLANALRRSVHEIPVLAIDEVDIYKNDSALYDEVLAHRLGLVPLKNQKVGKDGAIELKLKAKSKDKLVEVLSGEMGDDVVYSDMPLVILENGQEIELVARARMGKGIQHAKFSPGVLFYRHLAKIKLSPEGEKQAELAELYPDVFAFDGKLKIVDASKCTLDSEDFNQYPGVKVEYGDDLVFSIESWGQLEPKDIFLDAIKALQSNLSDVLKSLKG